MTDSEAPRREVELLIERGLVLPMTGEQDLLWDGAVAVDGGRIVAVGPTADLQGQFDARQTIDASEQLVMPGLVNTHMHLFGAFARGLVNDCPSRPGSRRSSTSRRRD